MKYLLITISLYLTACDGRGLPADDTKYNGITETCLNGVVYYQTRNTNNYYNYTPKFNQQSKVVTCTEMKIK